MVFKGFFATALFALGNLQPAMAGAPQPVPQAQAPAGRAESRTVAAVRVVQTLIDYTRWPQRPGPLELCTAGSAIFADRLGEIRLADGRPVRLHRLGPDFDKVGRCAVVYIGQLLPHAQDRLAAVLRGRSVLTIVEADPQCRGEAMFCLLTGPAGAGFTLDIDAVARSELRIDPRLLRLARGLP